MGHRSGWRGMVCSVRSRRGVLGNFLLVLVTLAITGCIEETRVVRVYPDGSGTIIERIVFNYQAIEMITEKDPGAESPEIPDKPKLRAAAPLYGEGISFAEIVEVETEFGKGYESYYEFTDINLVRLDLNLGNEVSRREFTTFTMQPGDPAELTIHWPADDRISIMASRLKEMIGAREDAVDTVQKSAEAFPEEDWGPAMQSMISMLDFRSAIYVEIVGQIVETNATYLYDNYITLGSIAYMEVTENEEAMRRAESWRRDPSVEEMMEFMTLAPDQLVETQSEITVRFE